MFQINSRQLLVNSKRILSNEWKSFLFKYTVIYSTNPLPKIKLSIIDYRGGNYSVMWIRILDLVSNPNLKMGTKIPFSYKDNFSRNITFTFTFNSLSYSVTQSLCNSLLGDVVLDSFNMVHGDEGSI